MIVSKCHILCTDAEKWIETSNFDKSYSVFMKLKAEVKDSGDYTCYNTESNEAFSKQSGNIYIYVFKPGSRDVK